MSVIAVPAPLVARVWPKAAKLLAPAISWGPCPANLDQVYEDLQARVAQLWLVDGGAIVTETYETDEGEICRVAYAGGSLEAGLKGLPTIEDWARRNGCTKMIVEGRKGWARALRPYGYAEARRVVEKDLI